MFTTSSHLYDIFSFVNELVLVVEDEIQIRKVVEEYLKREAFRVIAAGDGETALSMFRREKPEFVILDLNLPKMDGLDVARAIRKDSQVPIIMLTARAEEYDRLIGLELGADDYVTKPFSPRELVARVKVVLRRAGQAPLPTKRISEGDLEIDLDSHSVRRAGVPVELTPTEFSLLTTLAGQPGRVFSRLQLLESAQGQAYEGYERTIDAHIKNLRAKLEQDPRQPRYIETVFGIGYRFHKD
jgi:DNA-binding response OmpR family regulator